MSEKIFIDLLEELSNGMKYAINAAGTGIFYRPGVLMGGSLEMDCGTERSIGKDLNDVYSAQDHHSSHGPRLITFTLSLTFIIW